MGANITADQIVNHNLVAKGTVNGYNLPGGTVTQTFSQGATIGNVYSYITDTNGNVWWMFYATPQDYDNQNPFYVKHDTNLLDCPDLPGIMAQIAAAAEAAAIAQQGAIPYYLDKYLPWIVGGVVAAFVLPSLLKQKNVSGMDKKTKNLLLIGGAGVAVWYFFLRKPPTVTTVPTGTATTSLNSVPQTLATGLSSTLTNALKNIIAPLTPVQNNPQYSTVPITSAGQQISYDPTTSAPQQITAVGPLPLTNTAVGPLPLTYEDPSLDPTSTDYGNVGMNGRHGVNRHRVNGKGFGGKFSI